MSLNIRVEIIYVSRTVLIEDHIIYTNIAQRNFFPNKAGFGFKKQLN
jgi:hypothetical protein